MQQADVVSQTQGASRLVPASTVKDEDGVGARGHGAADLNQVHALPSGQGAKAEASAQAVEQACQGRRDWDALAQAACAAAGALLAGQTDRVHAGQPGRGVQLLQVGNDAGCEVCRVNEARHVECPVVRPPWQRPR